MIRVPEHAPAQRAGSGRRRDLRVFGTTLTRRGWAAAAGAAVLVAAGRILGVLELYVLAAACLGLLGAGLVSVARRVEVDATRTVDPPRVHAGGDARVVLSVRNQGRRPTPVLSVHDTLRRARAAPQSGEYETERAATRKTARFGVAPIEPGQGDAGSYRLSLATRGRYLLGPLRLRGVDPFGLVSSSRAIGPDLELTVYPAVDTIASLSGTHGRDGTGSRRPTAIGPSGEDLYGLREYQVGDDLRRVHWPSSARRDELMIRQLEQPWQGRATVLLDVRRRVHTNETFETAVSAAASVLLASWRQGSLVRLVTSDSVDSGFAHTHAHLEKLLEHLAVVQPSSAGDLAGPVRAAPGKSHSGALRPERPLQSGVVAIVTSAACPPGDIALLAAVPHHRAAMAVVLVSAGLVSANEATSAPVPPSLGGATVVQVSPSRPLAAAWNAAVAAASPGPSLPAPRR